MWLRLFRLHDTFDVCGGRDKTTALPLCSDTIWKRYSHFNSKSSLFGICLFSFNLRDRVFGPKCLYCIFSNLENHCEKSRKYYMKDSEWIFFWISQLLHNPTSPWQSARMLFLALETCFPWYLGGGLPYVPPHVPNFLSKVLLKYQLSVNDPNNKYLSFSVFEYANANQPGRPISTLIFSLEMWEISNRSMLPKDHNSLFFLPYPSPPLYVTSDFFGGSFRGIPFGKIAKAKSCTLTLNTFDDWTSMWFSICPIRTGQHFGDRTF